MRAKKPGIVCKVEFEKAFDNVNWNCLDLVMQKFGFGAVWRGWIRWCVSYARFSILINGEATSMFRSQKGIRKGDPISPFIFIMVVEILSVMIKKGAAEGLISGFQVVEGGTTIYHFQFADDLVVFLDDTEEQVNNLKNILFAFELVAGLKVNFRKSAIVGIGDGNNGVLCATAFGCQLTSFPMNYLGIPLGSKSKCEAIWEVVIQKCYKKLSTWRRKYLSKGQRLILINSVLESLPIYYVSMFQMLVSVMKTIEKIMRKFLWGSIDSNRKRSWVAWKKAILPKSRGGISIKKSLSW